MIPLPTSSSIEALELRLAPAGVVAFTTAGGTLGITGTADSEHIIITDNAATGEWTISYTAADEATTFKLNGEALTETSFTIAAPTSIKAVMGDGDDQIDLLPSSSGMIITGVLNLTMGKGADIVNLGNSHARALTVKGAVSVDLGDGADALNLNCDALFANSVTLKGGAQNDVITFLGASGGSSLHTFQKGLSVDLGSGSDKFLVESSLFRVVGGPVAIKAAGEGSADQYISFTPYEGWVDGAVSIAVAAGDTLVSVGLSNSDRFHFGSGLSISTSTGNDGVIFNGNVTIAGVLKTDLKDGQNLTKIDENGFFKAGSVSLKGGNQDDVLAFEKNSYSIINGALTTSFGAGSNVIAAFAEDAGGQQLSVGSISVVGASGSDAFVFEGAGLVVLGNANFALGAGDNIFGINGALVAYFGANVTVTTTLGKDIIGFTSAAVSVVGNLTITVGNGENSVGVGGRIDISGNLTVTGGSHDDALDLFGESVRVGRLLKFIAGDAAIENKLDIYASVSVFGSLVFQGGKGKDIANIGDFNASTSVLGSSAITLGAGFSEVFLNGVVFHGALNATSASASDQGDEFLMLSNLSFSTFSISLGAGSSFVAVDDSIFCDAFTASLGGGTDIMNLDGWDESSSINAWYGTLKINLGAGDDYLNLGVAEVETSGNFFSKAVSVDGGAGSDIFSDENSTYLVGTGPSFAGMP